MDVFGRTAWRMQLINLGIRGDCVESVLWGAQDISLSHTTFLVIMHCDINKVDQNQPKDIAVAIMKIAKTFTKKYPKINAIITGMLPRDKIFSIKATPWDKTNIKTAV